MSFKVYLVFLCPSYQIFFIMNYAFDVISRKSLLNLRSWRFPLMFYSTGIIVLVIAFRSVVQHHLQRGPDFPRWITLAHLSKINWHRFNIVKVAILQKLIDPNLRSSSLKEWPKLNKCNLLIVSEIWLVEEKSGSCHHVIVNMLYFLGTGWGGMGWGEAEQRASSTSLLLPQKWLWNSLPLLFLCSSNPLSLILWEALQRVFWIG